MTISSRDTESRNRQKIKVFVALGSPIIFGAILAILASQTSGITAAVGICALILLTSGSIGAGFGFLFALPRILTKDDVLAGAAENAAATKSHADPSPGQTLSKRLLGSNTNLERVSDWLTTMIVGVGLTQLGSINGALYGFRVFINDTAKVFPDAHGGNAGVLPSVGPMILLFGFVIGFLFLYLYTRITISVLLNEVETELQKPLPKAVADEVKELVNTLPGAKENITFASIASGDEPSVYASIELMGSLLYQPGRYQDVLDLAAKLSRTSAISRAEYWLYQAAAFGQKYHALMGQGGQADLQSARDNVLDCARRAVRINPSMKAILWSIADPDGEDDDLADFRKDAEFLKITGRWRKLDPGNQALS